MSFFANSLRIVQLEKDRAKQKCPVSLYSKKFLLKDRTDFAQAK